MSDVFLRVVVVSAGVHWVTDSALVRGGHWTKVACDLRDRGTHSLIGPCIYSEAGVAILAIRKCVGHAIGCVYINPPEDCSQRL